MPNTNTPAHVARLAEDIRNLVRHMKRVAHEIGEYGNFANAAELRGAAGIAESWANAIDGEVNSNMEDTSHD